MCWLQDLSNKLIRSSPSSESLVTAWERARLERNQVTSTLETHTSWVYVDVVYLEITILAVHTHDDSRLSRTRLI